MNERIDIIVPPQVLEENPARQERLRRIHRFEPVDRVPVFVQADSFYELAARGSSFARYIGSPRDNLREQILNRKWTLEHIRDDQVIETDQWNFVPDFGSLRASEFDMEINFADGQSPKCVHPLTEVQQIDDLKVPAPDNALNARYIRYYHAMKAEARSFDVRLNGRPVRLNIMLNHAGGPVPAAFALAGENLFLWMASEEQRVHRLMDIVTTSFIGCTQFMDEVCGRTSRAGIWLGCDAAEMISAAMFRQFVVPYYQRVYETIGGRRTFHMCGKIDHLLEVIRDDLKIDMLDGFGFPTDRHRLAEVMAGKVVMLGGPHPQIIRSGPAQRIGDECASYINTVGRRGGYILASGGGIIQDTPIEHLRAMFIQ